MVEKGFKMSKTLYINVEKVIMLFSFKTYRLNNFAYKLFDSAMELYFKEDRDKDFFEVCERIRKQNDEYVSVSDIALQAINQPAKSFYLSDQRYSRIIKQRENKKTKNLVKIEMHKDIYEKFNSLSAENTDLCVREILKLLSESPAPRFYLSHSRATELYYELLKHKK